MLYKFLRIIAAVLLAVTLAAAVLLPLVYDQRGYFAFGGEWFLIIGAGFAGYFYAKDDEPQGETDEAQGDNNEFF